MRAKSISTIMATRIMREMKIISITRKVKVKKMITITHITDRHI
jgi:hypothetical protein